MTDVVGGDRTIIVEVSFAVRDQNRIEEVPKLRRAPAVLREFSEVAREESKTRRVITFRPRKGDTIHRIVG